MPGTLLWCCHGEVIVLLATGYLGECQTASSSGPMSKRLPQWPSSDCFAHPLLFLSCFFCPQHLLSIPAHKDSAEEYCGTEGVAVALSYFALPKAWLVVGSLPFHSTYK